MAMSSYSPQYYFQLISEMQLAHFHSMLQLERVDGFKKCQNNAHLVSNTIFTLCHLSAAQTRKHGCTHMGAAAEETEVPANTHGITLT